MLRREIKLLHAIALALVATPTTTSAQGVAPVDTASACSSRQCLPLP